MFAKHFKVSEEKQTGRWLYKTAFTMIKIPMNFKLTLLSEESREKFPSWTDRRIENSIEGERKERGGGAARRDAFEISCHRVKCLREYELIKSRWKMRRSNRIMPRLYIQVSRIPLVTRDNIVKSIKEKDDKKRWTNSSLKLSRERLGKVLTLAKPEIQRVR